MQTGDISWRLEGFLFTRYHERNLDSSIILRLAKVVNVVLTFLFMHATLPHPFSF